MPIEKMSTEEMQKMILVGEGSFAKVYRVTEDYSGRMIACKVIRRKNLAEREADFLRRAQYPIFPRYFGVQYLQEGKAFGEGTFENDTFEKAAFEEPGKEVDYCLCLIMEYISGCSLKEFVRRRGRLSPRQAVAIAYALAEGLLYLHELPEPVIFRDLKPENIMIEQNGRVRLIDMGCAEFLESEAKTLGGTKGYAAPEQLERSGRAGVESDVYALGKVLLFMLTGKEEGNLKRMGRSKRTERIRRMKRSGRMGKQVPKIPAGLKRLVHNMTEQNQHKRIPDMRILMEALRPYTQEIENSKQHKSKKQAAFYYERDIKRGF